MCPRWIDEACDRGRDCASDAKKTCFSVPMIARGGRAPGVAGDGALELADAVCGLGLRPARRVCLKAPSPITLRFLRAAEQGRLHVVQMLIAGGVDVTVRGETGETVLHSAAGDGLDQLVSFLLPSMRNVDVRDANGATALHWAARRHKTAVVKLLLEHGADAAAEDKKGCTPMHAALESCCEAEPEQ